MSYNVPVVTVNYNRHLLCIVFDSYSRSLFRYQIGTEESQISMTRHSFPAT